MYVSSTMLYTDSATFYSILTSYRSKEYAQTSTWVLLEPAEHLFTYTKQLVLNEKDGISIVFVTFLNFISEIIFKNSILNFVQNGKLCQSY